MTTKHKAANRLAAAFVNGLRRELTTDQFAEMQRRNARESDPHICHSHDFIDANQVMLDAFAQTFGREAEVGASPECDSVMALFDAAWNLAKPSIR